MQIVIKNRDEIEIMADRLRARCPYADRLPRSSWIELAAFVIQENKNAVINARVIRKTGFAKCSPGSAKVLCDEPGCGKNADFIIKKKAVCLEHSPRPE